MFCEDPSLIARFLRSAPKEGLTVSDREQLSALLPVRFDEPLAARTTLRVGGPAACFVEVDSVEMLKKMIAFCCTHEIPFFVLGGGSNVLIRDGGIRGVVMTLGKTFETHEILRESNDDVFVAAGAATSLAKLVRWSVEQGLQGFVNLAGIPGVIGGNLRMNAGTREGAIGDVTEEVTLVDRDLKEVTLTKRRLSFEYRKFQLSRSAVITKGLFRLKRASSDAEREKLKELLAKRRETQPLTAKSCGCAFKNPPKGTSAGQLIEETGLMGVRVGGARVSDIHANFIINEGNATARDVEVLLHLIRDRVQQQTGVVLEPEVIIIGEERA